MENNCRAILEGLNSEQRLAVSCVDGPVLIVAGAGSGKTRVLTSRIAYILENGCDPARILALTFTKKAASEMKERISNMVGGRKAGRLYMGTFHSVFIRFLREYAETLGYPQSFTIYDTSDSVSAIKACLKELSLDEKVYKPKDVLSRISMAKNNLCTAEAYKANPNAIRNDTIAKKPRICDIYLLYDQKCRRAGVMDFDDILLNMNILLRDSPEALESIASRFDYIMVDEYQDTNRAQYLILKKLSQFHHNICVVGDDSQSIYAFRGAKIENILNFQKDYPQLHMFRLEQNYRSTKVIVDAANSLIERNSARIPKKCYSEGEQGRRIRLLKAYAETEEAVMIANEIVSHIHQDSAKYQDFAILYRTNAQSRAIEEALRKRNLPYMIYSGNSFFDRVEVKDMMAYFKLVANVNDDESFKRVVNKPARGIGETSLAALMAAARASDISLFRAAYSQDLEQFGLKKAAIDKIRAFCDMIDKLAVRARGESAVTVTSAIAIDSGLLQMYRSDTSIEGQSRTANVEELLNSVSAFNDERHAEVFEQMQAEGTIGDDAEMTDDNLGIVTLSDYLENVSLLSSVDMEDDEDSSNRVALMTVHSSKGLEFPYVFVAGMEENIFPSGGMWSSESEIEEERRLFYVAMTRAMKMLFLSFASTRMRNGKHESNSPSRFVKEIDRKFIENPISASDEDESEDNTGWSFGRVRPSFWQQSPVSRKPSTDTAVSRKPSTDTTVSRKPSYETTFSHKPSVEIKDVRKPDEDFVPTPILELKAGQRVEHNRFGIGKIISIYGSGADLKAKISFDSYGEKVLLLKYAKIRVI